MSRGRAALVASALGLALVSGSTPRLVGDGGEYLAMALNLGSLHRPAIAAVDLDWIQQAVADADGSLQTWDLRESTLTGRGGRRDFLHFWVYPLLAVPFLWITQLVHVTPILAFTGLNFALLAGAFWIALPRTGGAMALLTFGGPIVWWLDKPHTEPFTFALLTIAFVIVRDRPWWSMAAAGLAATQNPPIGFVVLAIAAAIGITRRELVRDRRFAGGLIAGVALAALQPVYALWRYDTPSLLLRANPRHMPSVAEVLAVPFDPAVGLLGNYPALLLVVAAAAAVAVARKPRELASADVVVTAVAAIGFLFSFSQAPNVHHGATPGLSRYAVWLVPLAIPIARVAKAAAAEAWERFLWTVAVVSSIACAIAFHPAVAQYTREPTWAATYLWTKHPGWHNPLPEVFAEIWNGGETRGVPVATPGCEKILIVGRTDGAMFPVPCFPDVVPPQCAAAGRLCYANRDGNRYRFVRAPGSAVQLEGFEYLPRMAWPAEATPHVRDVLTQSQWWTLEPKRRGEDIVREARGVRLRELEGPRRLVLILRDAGPEAHIALRPPWKMTGVLIDARTGQTIQSLRFDGEPFSRWDMDLPSASPLMLMSLWGS